MSRIGKMPIEVPEKVKVQLTGQLVKVTGPLGELSYTMHPRLELAQTGQVLNLKKRDAKEDLGGLYGLTRTLVANMVHGVSTGFSKQLEINGVGYRAEVKGQNLGLTLGFSHPVEHPIPKGIKIAVDKQTKLTVSGADRELVGKVAAEIRGYRPVEPYKGKGIKYIDEVVIRKVGKAAASGGGGKA